MASGRFGILIRQLSTSQSARGQLIQAPTQIYGIEGRYAHALYSAASRKKSIEKVESDLLSIEKLIATNASFREFLSNPTLKKKDKTDGALTELKKHGLHDILHNFIQVIGENGRFTNIGGIINGYKTIMSAYRGEVTCLVTTAQSLDSTAAKELETILKGFVTSDQVIKLTTKIDPNLIGGMILEIGDKYIDMSIASKVRTYKSLLEQGL